VKCAVISLYYNYFSFWGLCHQETPLTHQKNLLLALQGVNCPRSRLFLTPPSLLLNFYLILSETGITGTLLTFCDALGTTAIQHMP